MKISKWIHKNEGLILLLAFLVLLRIPSLFEPAWYGDENIYLAIGQGVRKGMVLYKDVTDYPNKPPFIYLLAAWTQRVFWFRALLLLWSSISVVLMFNLVKLLFKAKSAVWYVATFIFILFTSLPFWEGNIANGEIFMIMPVIAGMLLMWRGKYFWGGVMLGLGFLFKMPVAVDIAAAGLFFFILRQKLSLKKILKIFIEKPLYMWILGLVLPIGLMTGISMLQGVPPVDLLKNAVGSTGYVTVWEPQEKIKAWLTLGTMPSRLVALLILLGALVVKKKDISEKILFASIWFIFTLFGALLSGRPYPHYLLQIVPSLVILGAAGWVGRKNWKNLIVAGGVMFLMVGAIIRFDFGSYPVISYYGNFFAYASQQISHDEYINNYDWRMTRNYKVAKYIKNNSAEDDKIFIWGTDPGIYVLSDRLQVGRLVTSFHVEDLSEYERLGEQLDNAKPKYIVVMENEWREFIKLEGLIDRSYVKVEQIETAEIYRLIPKPQRVGME